MKVIGDGRLCTEITYRVLDSYEIEIPFAHMEGNKLIPVGE